MNTQGLLEFNCSLVIMLEQNVMEFRFVIFYFKTEVSSVEVFRTLTIFCRRFFCLVSLTFNLFIFYHINTISSFKLALVYP